MNKRRAVSPRRIFEVNLRRFIREGCNIMLGGDAIHSGKVISGQESGTAPSGLFVATWLTGSASNYPFSYFEQRHQVAEDESARTRFIQVVDASYMIQFYRKNEYCDANEAAQAFADWVDSHSGITWAATAITDGRITGVNVYQKQKEDGQEEKISDTFYIPNRVTKEVDVEPIAFENKVDGKKEGGEDNDFFQKAKVTFYTSSNGKIESGIVTDHGRGYIKAPFLQLQDFEHPDKWEDNHGGLHSGNTPPWASFRGAGFTIERPIIVSDITEAMSVAQGEWEPRAAIHLQVQYERHYADPYSRKVDPAGSLNEKELKSQEASGT